MYINEDLKATIHNRGYSRSKTTENVEYFNYLGSVIKYAKHTHEFKSRMTMAKAAFDKKALPISKLSFNLRKKLITCYIWSMPLNNFQVSHLCCAAYNHKDR